MNPLPITRPKDKMSNLPFPILSYEVPVLAVEVTGKLCCCCFFNLLVNVFLGMMFMYVIAYVLCCCVALIKRIPI